MERFSKSHRIWFSDIWGVVHDGQKPEAATVSVLQQHRQSGGIVILVTNSPRTSQGVVMQLDEIGVARDAYDAIVTSGDVTRDLIVEHGGGALFRIGPERDKSLFEGLNVDLVDLVDAKAVICSGLFYDIVETPADYEKLLRDIKARDLVMICANPDKIVRIGDVIRYCAGAVAEAYSNIGGRVLMAGKPYRPIYELAMKRAAEICKRPVAMSEVLAIGDGPDTDIKGAADFGLPVVLLLSGILAQKDKAETLREIAAKTPHANIVHVTPELQWRG
jgi:HAD superfamily hydrolase (TIGR01459 family)